MNNLDKKYQKLLSDIIEFGVQKKDRTGTGTISEFGHQIRHKMSEGFPLLTTKKMAFKTMVTELLWFLKGDTNIKYLVDNGCHIWDGDAYKNYCKKVIRDKDVIQYLKSYSRDENGVPTIELYPKEEFINKIKTDDEFAKKWGDLGPVYGRQWRKWGGKLVTNRIKEEGKIPFNQNTIEGQIDQIANLINELKTNPDSRRMIVSAWNPADLDSCVLPPCHYGFQMYTRELSESERILIAENNTEIIPVFDSHFDTDEDVHKVLDTWNIPRRAISLMFNMRSTDVGLGLGFNLASYGLLLMMIAKKVNMIPDELVYNGGDVHLYSNHIEPIKEQLTRQPYELPTLKLSDRAVNDISEYTLDDIILENYQSHPSIKMPLSN